MVSRRLIFLLAWASLAISAGSARAGDPVSFDPDGPAVTNPTSVIQSFDFLPGNSLTRQAIPFASGGLFNQFFQARLGSLLAPGNIQITPTGINSAFELTAVAGFTTVGTGITPAIVSFSLAPAPQQTVNFIELWFDPTPNAADLAGTGFTNEPAGDAVLVLRATIVEADGIFLRTSLTPVRFDQAGANDYPGVSSITGQGSFGVRGAVTFANPAFFTNPLQVIDFIINDSNTSAPFDAVDPSHQFTGGTVGASTIGGLFPANVGTFNGVTGPDIQFETDATTTFETTTIPEPATLVLLGLSAVTLAPSRRRKRS